MRRHHRTARRPAEDKEDGARGRHGAVRPKGLIWKGAVSFGLVNIPVTLHSGETSSELRFSMLDKRDLAPIGYRKINKLTGQDVPSREIVKGFKRAPNEFVVLTDDDFKKASPERTQRIDITAFVDGGRIAPAHYSRPYYLEPAAKSEKAYALLREAMRRADKVGIASVVLRAKQHLAALIVQGPVIMLELLRFPSELSDPADLHLPDEDLARLKISDAELKMAERLIEDLSAPWKPEQYKDEYRSELLEFIEAKAKAGKSRTGPAVTAEARPLEAPADIMSLLKKSLASSQHAR
jgi:DNA end-binding protein Ku